MPQIVTDRLLLRPYRKGEHHLMRSLIADPRVTFWREHPMPAAATRAIFADKLKLRSRGLGWFAAFLNDRVGFDGAPVFVGQVLLQPLANTDEIEIGWLFVPEHWGNGYAREAATALLHHGFTALGLDRIVAVVLPDNQRSLGVIHSLGLEEGPLRIHAGRPHRYFSLERAQYDARQVAVRALSE